MCKLSAKSRLCKRTLSSIFYIGEGSATMTRDGDTLALATLGRATEIEMTLSLLHCPRWPRQAQSCVTVADGFAYKCRQCKRSVMEIAQKS